AVIINESVSEFKNLSKTEKKERISKVKAAIQQYKTNLKLGEKIDDNKLLAIIFAILIPPVGVVLYENKVTTKFWISLLLTFIFWLPGMIYSLLVVTDNA
ncbi:MAG: YqaE/Pmp3 family membrane protein, partial [Chitinophagaceae bacterium]